MSRRFEIWKPTAVLRPTSLVLELRDAVSAVGGGQPFRRCCEAVNGTLIDFLIGSSGIVLDDFVASRSHNFVVWFSVKGTAEYS